jgi:hypothetical protein
MNPNIPEGMQNIRRFTVPDIAEKVQRKYGVEEFEYEEEIGIVADACVAFSILLRLRLEVRRKRISRADSKRPCIN